MYKIKSPKWRLPRFFAYGKYVVLVLMVIALPLLIMDQFNFGETWFCKWICPAGTLEAGLPLVAMSADIRGQIGFMFGWKVSILFIFLIWMIVSKRPFCRVFCPLGAILGLFNKASLFRMTVDEAICIRCNSCERGCPVDIKVYETPNSPECVRCLKCKTDCEYGAVDYEFIRMKPKERMDTA
jgi:polyferredoxin